MSDAQTAHQFTDGICVLLDEQREGCRLRIELFEEGMGCRAGIWPEAGGAGIAEGELRGLLETLGVQTGIDPAAVEKLCRLGREGASCENLVLARGIEPEPGPDGRIEFFVRVSSDQASYNEDESGRIDYRNSNLFSNLYPDQEIARIHPPRLGPPGSTVTGLPVPPLPGKAARIQLGEGVTVAEDRTYIVATKPGRAVYEQGKLSVREDFVIDGDLNLRIGHIDFNGFVHVKRDVLDDFNIKAKKGIKVDGAVGACHLESAGDIELGSMSGNEIGSILCKGNLKATFLNGVHVECYGDVIVQNEIRNSVIKAGKAIRVPNGAIFGGECVALEGIEARTVGSHIGVSTRLKVGVYFPEEDLLQDMRNQLRRATTQVKALANVLGPLSRKQVDDTIQRATQKRIEVLSRQLELVNEQKSILEEDLEAFRREEHEEANPKINIAHQISPGVYISFGGPTHGNDSQVPGPISIIENSLDEGLRYLPLTPLHVKAQQLESELAAQQQPDEQSPETPTP